MSFTVRKRFWDTVAVTEEDTGFQVTLDGRPITTPAKAKLAVPTRAAADLVAGEWAAVEGELKPDQMPATRWANSAIDKVTLQRAEVTAMLAEYASSDLLCYRAERPEGLLERQRAGWDPELKWFEQRFDLALTVTAGVLPVAQPEQTTAVCTSFIDSMPVFALTAFHDLVTLSGSFVLASGVAEGRLTPRQAWDLSRIDEQWQIDTWGADDEAEAAAQQKWADFASAANFFFACKG